MVGITEVKALPQGTLQTPQVGFSIPEKRRQRRPGVKAVTFSVVRHQQPVHASHIFAPTEDLANEALRGRQAAVAGAPRLLHIATQLQRLQQADIQIHGNLAVEQPGRRLRQPILIAAEVGQRVL